MKPGLFLVWLLLLSACGFPPPQHAVEGQQAGSRPSSTSAGRIPSERAGARGTATSFERATAEALPLGDRKMSREPQRGYVFACPAGPGPSGGAFRAGAWIRNGYWYRGEKPVVEGHVLWPNSAITVTLEQDQRVIRANNLPNHATGEFPIRTGTRAYDYDRNPNRIAEQTILLRLPAQPKAAATPGCAPMGMVGFILSGAAIFNAFDLEQRDAPAYEIQDRCNGHPEINNQYHYHDWSACIPDPDGDAGRHSSLVGFMLDGFPIYGPKGDGGMLLTDDDLDACHGHIGEVELDGKRVTIYHYHFTQEYPYTIGCFRGAIAQGAMAPNYTP